MCIDNDKYVYANEQCLRKYTVIANHLITNQGE